ncbi:MAG: hypothetical protein E7212_08660 [Clostridium sartagoforme]|nr:hypothetical protein [Clostridium sartagoforme]
MKLKLKNNKLVNTTYSLSYIVLSYVFTLWYQLEYLSFDLEASRSIIYLILNIIFVVLTLCFLKASNINIAILIITIFSIISLKVYAVGPIQILLNNKFSDSLPKEAIVTFAFIVQILILISNLAVSFYAIFRLHELQENRSNV